MKASELRAKSRRHMIRAVRAARFSARADARWAAARDARLAAEHQNAGAMGKAAATAFAAFQSVKHFAVHLAQRVIGSVQFSPICAPSPAATSVPGSIVSTESPHSPPARSAA